MIGFAISRFNDEWQACWLPDNNVWRPIDITQEQGEEIVAAIGLQGFTLFHVDSKGWQMSIRRHGQIGWSITHPSDEEANAILSMLAPIGHPDGPYRVKPEAGLTIAKYIALPDDATGEDVARAFSAMRGDEPTCRHGRPLHQDCFACDEEDGLDGVPSARQESVFGAGPGLVALPEARAENERLAAKLGRAVELRSLITATVDAWAEAL